VTADRLDWILNSDRSDQAALRARYDEWAETYDDDHDEWGWRGPEMIADAVLQTLGDSSAPIYDAGCGTGRAGVALRSAGWTGPIIGLDLSRAMLAIAATSGAYSELMQCSLYDLPVAGNSAGALVSSGVFTQGHVSSDAFSELARITQPGGTVAITMRTDLEDQFTPGADALQTASVWQRVGRTTPIGSHPAKNQTEQVVLSWRVTTTSGLPA